MVFLRNRSLLQVLILLGGKPFDGRKLLQKTTRSRTVHVEATKTAKRGKGRQREKASCNLGSVMSLPLATGQTHSNLAICGAGVRNYLF